MPSALDVVHTVASTRADHGGPSRSVPLLCTALAGDGLSIRLVTAVPANADIETSAILPADPVASHVVEEHGWASRMLRAPIGFYRALRAQVHQQCPDILHDHGVWLPSNGAAAVVARRFDVPLVISTRGMLSAWALNHNRWKKRLAWLAYQKRVLRQAHLFHVTSDPEGEILRRLGFDQPIAVIPNGVQLPDMTRAEMPRNTRRKALFLSRLHPKKGLPMLISAWARVRPSNWELVLVGPSENGHRAELEEQVRRCELTADVTFAGPVSDAEKWSWYRSADLFVLPTHSENFGIVIAEALASGLPVLTTTGAPWEELERHRCGWWADVGVRAITGALRKATGLTDEERLAMGQRGRTLVKEHYAWQHIGRKMHEVYAWVLGRARRPDCVHL